MLLNQDARITDGLKDVYEIPQTRIEIRAFITLPFHGMGIQAGGLTPVMMTDSYNHKGEKRKEQ